MADFLGLASILYLFGILVAFMVFDRIDDAILWPLIVLVKLFKRALSHL